MPSQRVNIELCCEITVSADKLAPNMLDNFGIIVVLSVIASLPHFIAESRPALLAGVTMEFQLVQNSIDTERYSDQYRYTKDELLSLRNTSHSRLPDNVFARIKELGIDKRRGCRAGSHKWRKIAVVEGRRRRTPKPPGVRAPQLIPIKTITTVSTDRQSQGNLPTIYMCNPRSLNNKLDEFSVVVHELCCDVCVVTETWFRADQPESDFAVDDYLVFAKSRDSRRGGGVAIYAKPESMPKTVNFLPPHPHHEVIWLQLRPKRLPRDISCLYVAAVYSPPDNDRVNDLIQSLVNAIDDIKTRHGDAGVVILGDFNRADTSELTSTCNLRQVVRKATRGTAILDLILTYIHQWYSEPEILSPLGLGGDHNAVLWKPKLNKTNSKNKAVRKFVRPMKDSAIREFGQWISQHTWDDVMASSSAQEKCDKLYASLQNAMDEYLPMKSVKMHPRDKPWVTPYLKSLIGQRQKAFSNDRTEEWKRLRNKVQNKKTELKKNFYKDRVLKLKRENPSSWYKHLKIMTSSKTASNIIIPESPELDDLAIADCVNDHFANVSQDIPELDLQSLPAYLPTPKPQLTVQPHEVYKELNRIKPGKSSGPDGIPARIVKEFAVELASPLCEVLNSSYHSGSVPSQWKGAIIAPIPKEKAASSIDKQRPISLTDHFAKIAEVFIYRKLLADVRHQLDPKQFGARAGRSTTHCLVEIYNFLCKRAELPSNVTSIVSTDFSRAFDRVDHTILIRKLITLEVHPWVIVWICSFLTDRQNQVRYHGELSSTRSMTAGVPQGTRLGPLLFLVLIDDALRESEVERWKYVDDMSLASAEPSNQHGQFMQNVLVNLEEWCNQNNVRLNPKKCNIMRVTFSKTPLPDRDFSLCNDVLQEVSAVKLLGVILQRDLKWNDHVSVTISRASSRLYMLRRLKEFHLPAADLVTVYVGFVRPLLEYACPVWHSSLTCAQSAALERIQKRALRLIFPGTSYNTSLDLARIVDLETRRKTLCINFATKASRSEVGSDWFTENNPTRNLRKNKRYREPRCRTNRYQNSPIPFMTKLLNSN